MVYLVFFDNHFRHLFFVHIVCRPYPGPVGSYREGLAYNYIRIVGKSIGKPSRKRQS